MQEKISPDRTRGMNLISLFAKLFFSGREYSLIGLAKELGCSKQTVLSLVEELEQQHWIIIDSELRGGRRYYRMRKAGVGKARMALTDEELDVLLMCRAFTGHLLGRDQFDTAMSAIHKSRQMMDSSGGSKADETDGWGAGLAGDAPFGIYRPGAIDYTPHQKHWHTLDRGHGEGPRLRDHLPQGAGQEGQAVAHQTLEDLFPPREHLRARPLRQDARRALQTRRL